MNPFRSSATTHSALAIVAVVTISSLAASAALSAGAPAPGAETIARGKYLVNAIGCGDCHTPLKMGANGPEADMSRMLSGHPENVKVDAPAALQGSWMAAANPTMTAWSGPWGVSFTANLSPDPETGLGRWTARNFIDTIRSGRHLGRGRPLLPPMPYPFYRNMTDEDLGAVFAYLQTIPAVKNRVPEPLAPEAAIAAN